MISNAEFFAQDQDLADAYAAGELTRAEYIAARVALADEWAVPATLAAQVVDFTAEQRTVLDQIGLLNLTGAVATVGDLPGGAANGDTYLVNNNGHAYLRLTGQWKDLGPYGGRGGIAIFTVTAEPAADLGVAGDVALNRLTGEFWGPKTSSGWGEAPSATWLQSEVDAAVAATTAATAAAAAANAARDGATFKAVYATRAELYADLGHAAKTFGIIYDDATPAYNGTYIKTGGPGAGAWAKQATTGGLVYQTLPAESGYIGGLVDALGRAAWLVGLDGTFVPSKIALPAESVASASLGAAAVTMAKLDPSITGILDLAPRALSAAETGFVWGLVDSLKRMAMAVRPSGAVLIPKLELGDGAVGFDALASAVVDLIARPLNPESGYYYAVTDVLKRIALGVRSDGTLSGYIDRARVADNAYSGRSAKENADYIVIPFQDDDGFWQIKTQRKSDGAVAVLTTGGHHLDPYLTNDDFVSYWSVEDDGLRVIPAEGGVVIRMEPETAIVCWGDSMTDGVGAIADAYPDQLAINLGRNVYNGGIGGQTSSQIAARQGGRQSLLTVSGNQIPASGGVTVTNQTIQLLNGQATSILLGSLAGIPGTLSWSAGPVFTFTRATAGSVVACPAGTPFIPTLAGAYENRMQLLWYGRNNRDGGGNLTTAIYADLKADIDASIAFMKPYGKRYAVIGIINGVSEPSGSAVHTAILAVNAMLAADYPGRYIDGQSPPTTDEMAAIGFTPDSTDLADIAAGSIPTGMRAGGGDLLHGNAFLYALIALRVQTFIEAKGW